MTQPTASEFLPHLLASVPEAVARTGLLPRRLRLYPRAVKVGRTKFPTKKARRRQVPVKPFQDHVRITELSGIGATTRREECAMTPDDVTPATKPKNFFAANSVNTLVVVSLIVLFTLVLLPAIITRNPHGALDRHNSNNLKQLALAQHNFEGYTRSGLVGPYAFESGAVNRGHSFRVSLLPYMEQDGLFKRIDLTQPWDSAKNAPVTAVAIRNLQSPDTPDRAKPDTPYRVFYGGGALFEADGMPVKLADIPDGASSTILFVHATETVPWAKPQEFAYTPTTPLPPLGSPGLGRGGFNAAMADGSVRFFKATIAEADLRSLIEKADGRGRDIE